MIIGLIHHYIPRQQLLELWFIKALPHWQLENVRKFYLRIVASCLVEQLHVDKWRSISVDGKGRFLKYNESTLPGPK